MNSLMNSMVLQCADHLQPGAIADVSEPRITMSTEISLENASVFCAIEHCAPCLELAHAVGRFLRVQFSHAPLMCELYPEAICRRVQRELPQTKLQSPRAIPRRQRQLQERRIRKFRTRAWQSRVKSYKSYTVTKADRLTS